MFPFPLRSGNKRTSGHIQLIDRTGNFDVAGMERFSRENELAQCGLSCGIVAIMGPKSSGKSTLLNHLYDTDFKEMDASGERQQTTQGIWLGRGKSTDFKEMDTSGRRHQTTQDIWLERGVGIGPLMLVLDLEGSDASERGQDVDFEKQSALLALAVSDIVLINMPCNYIGLERAASRPLLKTLLQERMQMTRLRRITLMFVLRDKPKVQSAVEGLKRQLLKDVEKIWDTVHKPEKYRQKRLGQFFNVEIEALSHYEHKKKEFGGEVVNLRLHLSKIIAPESAFVPASGFSQFVQNVWTVIKANKNLNLPTEEIMVARALCEETAKTTFDSFIKDEEWCKLSVDAKSCANPGFGRKLTLLFERCLLSYDEKVEYFHEDGRRRGRESLTRNWFKHVEPTVSSLLQNLHSEFLAKFKDAFDKTVNEERFHGDADNCTLHWIGSFRDRCADVMMEGATWDIPVSERNFRAEVKAHIMYKLKAKLDEALKEPVQAALRTADENTWPALATSISLLHDEDKNEIKSHARSLIDWIARKVGEKVFRPMEERFEEEFMPVLQRGGRKGKEGIKGIAKQLINGIGNFDVAGMERFSRENELAQYGLSYGIVAIMGPQSSGKSTLLNRLYDTDFKEMDASGIRQQTTQGIWLGRGVGIDPLMLVLDLEGLDGSERGQEVDFEKQSALLALAVSDIVLINMWCKDVGLEHGACRPLLKTLLQERMQMTRLRRITLMFVLRDKPKVQSQVEALKPKLRKDVEKIWDTVHKPEQYKQKRLSDFFSVEIEALSHYEYKREEFDGEVVNLRLRLSKIIAPQGAFVPASGFSQFVQNVWKDIKENKNLNLPTMEVLVATVRCEEKANNMFTSFTENEKWSDLETRARSGEINGFRDELISIINSCISQYDEETRYFDEGVRLARRNNLDQELLLHVRPTFESIIGHLWSEAFDKFKDAFDQALNGGQGFSVAANSCTMNVMSEFDIGCADVVIQRANWDTSKERGKLFREIENYIGFVRDARLSELTDKFKGRLYGALDSPVNACLEKATDDTWRDIRNLLKHKTESAVSGLSSELSTFNIDETMRDNMLLKLKGYARGVVESKAKKEAGRVLTLMKDRFATSFHYDSNYQPRVWSGTEGIEEAAEAARFEALKLLSVMAAIRLGVEVDDVKRVLSLTLVGDGISHQLASDTWKGIPSSMTLLSPLKCKSLWKQFMADTENTVNQAIAAQTSVAQDTGRNNSSIVPAAAPNPAASASTGAPESGAAQEGQMGPSSRTSGRSSSSYSKSTDYR